MAPGDGGERHASRRMVERERDDTWRSRAEDPKLISRSDGGESIHLVEGQAKHREDSQQRAGRQRWRRLTRGKAVRMLAPGFEVELLLPVSDPHMQYCTLPVFWNNAILEDVNIQGKLSGPKKWIYLELCLLQTIRPTVLVAM
ncbi:hypothetical protein NDU88_003590 [Pleurodeles waltl]|uniref:Uncharacterized protein n=1 Tax=Pleurodeles waltl TaxID=8319 RepID=A0AAV7T5Q0_PLEWA|nr:hypothetical protein NDU88_003590 [Pleurodeles waltl]